MTRQKLLIAWGYVVMATVAAVCLPGCAANAGAMAGPHPRTRAADSYSLKKDAKDANTVALTIIPDSPRVRDDGGVQPVNLHFKTPGHANAIAVSILEREGKQPKLVITPLTTGPHPIVVSIETATP